MNRYYQNADADSLKKDLTAAGFRVQDAGAPSAPGPIADQLLNSRLEAAPSREADLAPESTHILIDKAGHLIEIL